MTVDYNLGKKVTDTLYETKYLDTKDKYSVFLDGNQPITKITTGNKNGRKLMLIKDSYANSFATFAANDYEEVYLVDCGITGLPFPNWWRKRGSMRFWCCII